MNQLDFHKLSELVEQDGISQQDLIRAAGYGDLNLYVWFEGLLLETISPALTWCSVKGVDDVMRLATDEMRELMAQGKCVPRIGQMLFNVHDVHKGWIQIPSDEIPALLAQEKVKVSCLLRDKKLYRCHAMDISQYDTLRRDPDQMRKICEGQTIKPEYSIKNLFLKSDDAVDLQTKHLEERRVNSQKFYSSKAQPIPQQNSAALNGYAIGDDELCKVFGVGINSITSVRRRVKAADMEFETDPGTGKKMLSLVAVNQILAAKKEKKKKK